MNQVLKIAGGVGLVVVVLGLVAAVGGGWLAERASAQPAAQQDGQPPQRTVTVSGQGRVGVRPDLAIVRLGVQTESATAAEAMDENNVRMQAVISATLEAGVEEDDIQTQSIQLYPVYRAAGDNPPELTGYQAANVVEVTVRELANLGALLDAAVAAGGNTIESIRFEVSNPDEMLAEAREAAMSDARQKAEQLTSLAGADLGQVMTITEIGSTPPTPVFLERADAAGAAVPVQPGTQFIEASVQVVWEIQ